MRKTPFFHIAILGAFIANSCINVPFSHAQDLVLPKSGSMVKLSSAFNPPVLKGIKVNPDNPFQFEFVLDKGGSHSERSEESQNLDSSSLRNTPQNDSNLKSEANKLIKYFLASLTVPEQDLWVNLSPYEKDRIIPDAFGQTEMGRDLLAQDYILKQLTASLMYPEDEVGKKFWKRVYEESVKKFGNINIPVNTFNKVWIVPEKVVVYENIKNGTAYVVESKLKVMLEEDYHALARAGPAPELAVLSSRHLSPRGVPMETTKVPLTLRAKQPDSGSPATLAAQIIHEVVIPQLYKEINEGQNFAQLRQIYNSLILATWYKKKLKNSILAQVYTDKNKIKGIGYSNSVVPERFSRGPKTLDSRQKHSGMTDPEAIYQNYLHSFKKGAYNYIKEEQDPVTQQMIPRKYFSGGATFGQIDSAMTITPKPPVTSLAEFLVETNLVPKGLDIPEKPRADQLSIVLGSRNDTGINIKTLDLFGTEFQYPNNGYFEKGLSFMASGHASHIFKEDIIQGSQQAKVILERFFMRFGRVEDVGDYQKAVLRKVKNDMVYQRMEDEISRNIKQSDLANGIIQEVRAFRILINAKVDAVAKRILDNDPVIRSELVNLGSQKLFWLSQYNDVIERYVIEELLLDLVKKDHTEYTFKIIGWYVAKLQEVYHYTDFQMLMQKLTSTFRKNENYFRFFMNSITQSFYFGDLFLKAQRMNIELQLWFKNQAGEHDVTINEYAIQSIKKKDGVVIEDEYLREPKLNYQEFRRPVLDYLIDQMERLPAGWIDKLGRPFNLDIYVTDDGKNPRVAGGDYLPVDDNKEKMRLFVFGNPVKEQMKGIITTLNHETAHYLAFNKDENGNEIFPIQDFKDLMNLLGFHMFSATKQGFKEVLPDVNNVYKENYGNIFYARKIGDKWVAYIYDSEPGRPNLNRFLVQKISFGANDFEFKPDNNGLATHFWLDPHESIAYTASLSIQEIKALFDKDITLPKPMVPFDVHRLLIKNFLISGPVAVRTDGTLIYEFYLPSDESDDGLVTLYQDNDKKIFRTINDALDRVKPMRDNAQLSLEDQVRRMIAVPSDESNAFHLGDDEYRDGVTNAIIQESQGIQNGSRVKHKDTLDVFLEARIAIAEKLAQKPNGADEGKVAKYLSKKGRYRVYEKDLEYKYYDESVTNINNSARYAGLRMMVDQNLLKGTKRFSKEYKIGDLTAYYFQRVHWENGELYVYHAPEYLIPSIMIHLDDLWSQIMSLRKSEKLFRALAEYEWWFFQANPFGRGGAGLGDAMSTTAQIVKGIPLREEYVHADFEALSRTLDDYIKFRVEQLKARLGTVENIKYSLVNKGMKTADFVRRVSNSIRPNGQLNPVFDSAQMAGMDNKGGIDFKPERMDLQIKRDPSSPKGAPQDDAGFKFKIDPAMMKQLQDAPGFEPVIINIVPLKDLNNFLGV